MTPSFPTVGSTVMGSPEMGRLQLLSVLGAGSFGIVFEAKAEDGVSRFAVKFLQAGLLATAEERQALFNEVLASREISHPNVLRLHHFGQESELPPYLVIEYADSGTLLSKIQQARASAMPIPLDLVQAWSLDLMCALAAINERIIHRDVKPDNILFVGDVLKVGDFGLAKLVGAATRTHTFKGGQHVLYMAPEGWAGRRNEIQLDMYALGIVLYELATLRYPYSLPSSNDIDAFRRMHLFQAPESAKRYRPDLPQRMDEVIGRLMSKRPENRYSTWAQPIEAIRAAFEPASHPAPAPVNELIKQAAKRHRQDLESRTAAELERSRINEERQIDRAQEEEIVSRLRVFIELFNKDTEGPKASLQTEGGHWSIDFPYAKSATLSFFPANPSLTIPPFTVRYIGLLANDVGCGFNVLLRRRQGELHGEWVVCRIRTNPLLNYVHRPSCKYFGLDSGEVEHIERGLRALHVYVPEIIVDVDTQLAEFVKSLYSESF